jgi:hypothetical protein
MRVSALMQSGMNPARRYTASPLLKRSSQFRCRSEGWLVLNLDASFARKVLRVGPCSGGLSSSIGVT